MLNNQPAVADTAGDGIIDKADVDALLAELNLDSLLASLDSTPAPKSTPPADAASTPTKAGAAPTPTKEWEADDRRAARRRELRELSGEIRMTIPGVSDVLMVNISETGALIETSRRLSPGTGADLFVRINGKRHAVRATTVRSVLQTIPRDGALVYRSALHFDKRLPLDGD